MSTKPVVQLYSGKSSIEAAQQYEDSIADRQRQWPFVHVFPPPMSRDVLIVGSVVTQAQAAAAVQVVSHRVSSGKRFFLQAVLFSSTAVIVPGQALFTLDRNQAVGATNTQFMPEHGLINVPLQLGSQLYGPWKLQRARVFEALDVVRIKATNVGLSVGDPTYWICGLFGYEIPTADINALK